MFVLLCNIQLYKTIVRIHSKRPLRLYYESVLSFQSLDL